MRATRFLAVSPSRCVSPCLFVCVCDRAWFPCLMVVCEFALLLAIFQCWNAWYVSTLRLDLFSDISYPFRVFYQTRESLIFHWKPALVYEFWSNNWNGFLLVKINLKITKKKMPQPMHKILLPCKTGMVRNQFWYGIHAICAYMEHTFTSISSASEFVRYVRVERERSSNSALLLMYLHRIFCICMRISRTFYPIQIVCLCVRVWERERKWETVQLLCKSHIKLMIQTPSRCSYIHVEIWTVQQERPSE